MGMMNDDGSNSAFHHRRENISEARPTPLSVSSFSEEGNNRNAVFRPYDVKPIQGDNFKPIEYTYMHDPESRIVKCNKPLPNCSHLCQDAKILNITPCQSCVFVKEFERHCGHTTTIYCGADKPYSPCKFICGKVVKCTHSCREICHYGSDCLPNCGEFTCKPDRDPNDSGPTGAGAGPTSSSNQYRHQAGYRRRGRGRGGGGRNYGFDWQ